MAPAVTPLAVSGVELGRAGRTIVRDLTFALAPGERAVLMGPSGTGKTTVLRAIAGLEPVVRGSIEVDGSGPPAAGARPSRVGMVFQFHHLFAHLTAIENVWLAPVHVLRQPRADAEVQARALLEKLGVAHRAAALPHELSGGEAQRVAIARALAVNPRLLLMDEPTASLDPDRRGELATVVRHLSDDGTTLLVATHDAEFARSCAQRVLMLQGGRLARDGPVAEILKA